jgi:hypothetical protein
MNPVNLGEKLATFKDHWQPRTIGQFNGHDLMVVKAQGEFVWHKHDDTDDFFLVLEGRLTICATARSSWDGASSSWCPRAWSTGRWRRRRCTFS